MNRYVNWTIVNDMLYVELEELHGLHNKGSIPLRGMVLKYNQK